MSNKKKQKQTILYQLKRKVKLRNQVINTLNYVFTKIRAVVAIKKDAVTLLIPLKNGILLFVILVTSVKNFQSVLSFTPIKKLNSNFIIEPNNIIKYILFNNLFFLRWSPPFLWWRFF